MNRHTARLMMLCLVLIGLCVEPALAQAAPSILAQFSVNPLTGVVGETDFAVAISLHGDASACPALASRRPVDAAMLLDASVGMAGEPLDSTRAAAKVFLQTVNLDVPRPPDPRVANFTGDQVALVTFSDAGKQVAALTSDSAALTSALDSLSADSLTTTNIAAGLTEATNAVIDPTYRNPIASSVIVLLSDGGDNSAAAAAADKAKAAGIRIVTVALGNAVAQPDARALLQNIATSPADYHEVTTPGDLSDTFRQIAQEIQPATAATNISFSYQYDSTSLTVDPNSIFPPPSQIEGNVITWVYGHIDNGEAPQFTFHARASQPGTLSVGSISSGSYYLCEATTLASLTGSGPSIVAQSPTPLPLPTATFTPQPSSTPVPTAPPAPPAAVVNTGFAPAAEDSSLIQALGFCADGLGSVLPLLIALLIILFLLIPWLWWHFRRLRRGDCGPACFLLWSLFGIYAAFALWLLLLPTSAAACEGRESVYFWRQDGASREMGVYLTAPNLDSASSFAQMNSDGCVGCHVVSSAANRVAAIQGPPPNQILIRNFDGSAINNVPSVSAVYMSFSPDGQRLVFSDNKADLYILDIASGKTTPLSGASQPNIAESMPSWGPNNQIAFVRAPDLSSLQYDGLYFDAPVDIYTIPDTGGTPAPLAGASGDGFFNYYPSYSPDGKWLAFTRHQDQVTYSDPKAEIFVVPAGGGTSTRLNANDDANGQPIPDASNSWPTWSLDGKRLAFNTKRSDDLYDIYVTNIDTDTGQSGAAQPLKGAAEPGVFEHTPFWGLPIAQIDVLRNTLALWPFLLPLLPLAMFAWVACRRRTGEIELPPEPVKVRALPPPPIPAPLRLKPLAPPWQPQPALIIGLGATGREVLTQMKKTLRDAQLGEMPARVRLIGLDTGDYQTLQGQTAPIAFAGIELNDGEIIELKDNLATVVNNPDFRKDPLVRGWLTDDALRTIGSEDRANLRRGANKMRLLARAGLIHHLRSAKPNFFDRLLNLAPDCLTDDRELNVIIVGDTFGDIGSAVLFDVALLAREAAARSGAQAVAVTAHLITHEAVRNFTDNPQQDRVNTGATLREIERFQLAEARPFPIFYPQIASPVCDRLPLDDLFLYDGHGLELIAPREGIFPAVADAIALWLDKASAQGDLRQLQSDQRRLISQEQRNSYEVHVFSQGMFTYRLPFSDLLENIRARFAQEIVHTLITGGGEERQIGLDPTFKAETYVASRETPEEVVRAFLTGALSVQSSRPAPGYTLAVLRAAIDPGHQNDLIPSLRRLEADAQERLLAWLRGALQLLLNGKQETAEVDIFQARGGKLGFALAFLEALDERIDRITTTLDTVHDASDKRDQLKAILAELKTASAKAGASLKSQAQALGATDGINDNLHILLGKRSFNLEARLKQMTDIKTRRYISTRRDENGKDQELADLWYRTYLDTRRGEALRQFYWRIDEQFEATLLLYGESETPLDPSKVAAFERELIDMATRYCADIKDNARLSDLLSAEELAPYQLGETGQTLLAGSQALLNYERTAAVSAAEDSILSANETVDVDQLYDEIAQRVGGAQRLKRMNSTDPYSLSLNRRTAIIPFNAISTLAGAREDYRRNHNLSSNPKDRRQIAIPTAVYEAEASALILEARILDELRLRPDLLHPLVVTALTIPERVTAYTLLLASGELGLQKLRGRPKSVLVMYAESGEVVFPETFQSREIVSDLHPLAQGLLMFILDKARFPDALVDDLMNRFQTDPSLPEIWKQWVDGAWQEWLDEIDENDARSYDIVTDILKVSRLYANQYRL